MESPPTVSSKRLMNHRPIVFYVMLTALLYVAIRVHSMLSPIILSFILIILITLALNPIILRMKAWTGGRRRAIGMVLIGMLTLGGLLVWATAGAVHQAAVTLSDKLPAYWERLQKPLIMMEQKGVISEEKLQKEVSEQIANEAQEQGNTVSTLRHGNPTGSTAVTTIQKNGEKSLRSDIGGIIEGLFGQAKGATQSTTQVLIVFVTVFFGAIFTLLNPNPVFGALFSVVPEHHHDQALAVMMRIAKFVPRWAGSVLVSMISIGSLFFLLMWPIFGFVDAIMLGLIAFVLSVIPFLGPIMTLIPALLLALGEGGMTPIWVLLAYGAVQVLEGNVIFPLVMSHGMQLHPLSVIFSMLFSVALFGVLGILIAAPLVAVVGILYEELYRERILPTTTDKMLAKLAGISLLEDRSEHDSGKMPIIS